jgi:hypothetical protein
MGGATPSVREGGSGVPFWELGNWAVGWLCGLGQMLAPQPCFSFFLFLSPFLFTDFWFSSKSLQISFKTIQTKS